jgi:hypothetical protein
LQRDVIQAIVYIITQGWSQEERYKPTQEEGINPKDSFNSTSIQENRRTFE